MNTSFGLPAFIAIGLGGALGACSRHAIGLLLNGQHHTLPVGTLVANIVGGLLIGLSVGWIERMPELDPVWRLAIVTGFLGALTTFSTFSVESVMMISRGQYGWAFSHSALHFIGSIGAAAIGLRLTHA